MEKLAAGLSERQITEFVEDDEVHPGQMLGDTTLPSVAGLDLEAVDEVDHVVVAPAAPDRMQFLAQLARWVLPVPVLPTNGVEALAMNPPLARSLTSVWLMGCPRTEVLKVLGKRQFGDGELVLDRASLLLIDLGVEQVANNTLGFARRLTAVVMISSKAAFMP